MPDPALDPAEFRSLDALNAQLDDMLAAGPKSDGRLDLIMVRPDRDRRQTPESFEVRTVDGLPGDHWITGTSYKRDDGTPDPDAQICMMMSGCIGAIAGDKANRAPAGDNLFLDMDLTPANMPPGTRFAIGTAEFVFSELPHYGCERFIDRHGRDACLFVNTGPGWTHRLYGTYSRVTREGIISVGNRVA